MFLEAIGNPRSPGQYYDAETGLNYNMNRDYDPAVGRYIEPDAFGQSDDVDLYTYVSNQPTLLVDPEGLFAVKSGVPTPSAAVQALLTCIETCYGQSFTVTATTDSHPAASPHGRGQAADIRYPADPAKLLCCAGQCGAGFALDENKHPSTHSTAAHVHIQLPNGRRGGHGDLPPSSAKCSPSGCGK